jgi:HAMP domain-containing protein
MSSPDDVTLVLYERLNGDDVAGCRAFVKWLDSKVLERISQQCEPELAEFALLVRNEVGALAGAINRLLT